MNIRSMTGFARVQKSSAEAEIAVSLKSVNHRGLDLHFHCPAEIDPFENAIRTAIKKAVLRGHVDVRVSVARQRESETGLNEAMLKQYLSAFRRAAEVYGLTEAEPDLNAALRIPGMLGSTVEEQPSAAVEPLLMAVLEEVWPELECAATPREFVAYWFANDARVDGAVLNLVRDWRKGGGKAYLGTVQEHFRASYLWLALGLARHFDDIHYSAALGAM